MANAQRTDRARDPVRQTREQEETHPAVHGEDEASPWELPTNLAAPAPRAGYVQRWIRVGIRGVDDATNLAKAMQMGWEPRQADSVANLKVPTIKHGEFTGVIGVHGMVLMERPVQLDEQYKAAVNKRTAMLTRAVTADLERTEHRDMPLEMHTRSKVERGRARRPLVAPDPQGESTEE